MPARPIAPETLRLIDAVRDALAAHAPGAEVEEKSMFGSLVFMVNGKMCLGVDGDELLVRLPPTVHDAVAETPDVRPLSSRGLMQGYFLVGPAAYATRDAWQGWIDGALAFNPQAKATPKKKRKTPAPGEAAAPAAPADNSGSNNSDSPSPATRKRHSVFDSD